MSAEAIERVSPWLDAANVDLKAYTEDFYKQQCGARLEPVKETLRRLKALKVWVEVTTLIIPGLNDGPKNSPGWQPSLPRIWAPKPHGT
jgi:pyruvate formate lyase activating enzyme